MQGFIILSSSLVATLLLTLLPGLRQLRQALTVSPGRTFFLVVAFTGVWLGSSTGADLQSNLPDPVRLARIIVFITLSLIALFLILRQLGTAIGRAGAGAQWMAIYALFAMYSATWSVGPLLSLWKGFEVLALVMVAVAIATRLRTLEDLQWLHYLTVVIILFLCFTVLMGFAFYPLEAVRDPDTGLTTSEAYFSVRGLVPNLNPSSIGSIGAMLSVMAVASILHADFTRTSRSGLWALLGMGVLTMILAHSRTPIFACTASILLLLAYARRWRLLVVTAVFGAVLLAATALEDIVLKYIYRGQTVEAFTSLTGRLGVWEIFWAKFLDAPILGHGYYAAQRILFGTSSVDNSYLEVLLGVGLAGLAIFIVPLLWAGFRLNANRPKNRQVTLRNYLWLSTAGVLAVIAVRGFTAPSFQVLHPLLIVYLLMQISVAALLRMRAQPVEESRQTRPTGIPPSTGRRSPQQKRAQGLHTALQTGKHAGKGNPALRSQYIRRDEE
jgi:O-antigen ligase